MAAIEMQQPDKRQIQPAGDYRLAQPARTRGLMAQISTALLQPALFFRTLPIMESTRQWLWIALLVLTLVGYSAVRQQTAAGEDTSEVPAGDMGGIPIDSGMNIESGEMPIDGGLGVDFGFVPPANTSGQTPEVESTDSLTIALIAASGVFVGWAIQTALLSEVTLLNGRAPRFGHNFQIAVWSSLPLALMALIQVIVQITGGTIGAPGLTGLVDELSLYDDLPVFARSLIFSLAANLTIFWLWSLMLIYFGARVALRGRRWSSLLVVASWVIVLVTAPVITGQIDAAADAETAAQDGMPVDGMFPIEGGMMGEPQMDAMGDAQGGVFEVVPDEGATPSIIDDFSGLPMIPDATLEAIPSGE
jgi:hypothetical protein